MQLGPIIQMIVIICLPAAVVIAGLVSSKKFADPWWSKLLIILGCILLVLVFLTQIHLV